MLKRSNRVGNWFRMEKKRKIPKRQHFVSQFYLNHFAQAGGRDGNRVIHIADKKTHKYRVDKVENVAFQNDFYNVKIDLNDLTKQGWEVFNDPHNVHVFPESIIATVEYWLASIESEIAISYHKIVDTGSLHGLELADRANIAKMLALFWLRTPLSYQKFVHMGIKQAIKRQYLTKGLTKKAINREQYKKLLWESSFLPLISDEAALFAARRWTLLRIDPLATRFITSDNPVQFSNPMKENSIHKDAYGPKVFGTLTYLPLTPYLALKVDYEIFQGEGEETMLITKGLADYLNNLQQHFACRFIYSANKYVLIDRGL